jgi:hypothetical protein
MRVLFIGDIVGAPGIRMVVRAVPWLRQREHLDFVIANAENATGGSGLSPANYRQLREAGVDGLTMGDHIYKKADIIPLMDQGEPIGKPANFPATAPGREWMVLNGPAERRLAVVSLMGRSFMKPVDCPFLAIDRVLTGLPADVRAIFVDVHAEATGDKYQLAHYLKGRVSAVVGTHTHVPTADERVFPEGTAFVCDVGMTGPYASILGRRIDRVLPAVTTFVPHYFDVATDDVRLGGALVDIDDATGQASAIRRLMITEAELDEPN